MSQLTIAQVEKEIDELEAKHGHRLSVEAIDPATAFDPASILIKICATVAIAMPALKLAKQIFFFSKKIQKVIQTIIDIAGMACGDGEEGEE